MGGHAATAGPGPPVRLLLADGDPSLRRVLDLALHARGYQVALADALTLTKPFGIGQLLERLQALRTPAHSPPGRNEEHATGADAPWTPS